MKYQSNPKVMGLVLKLSSKMNLGGLGAGFGGLGGGFPGACPGFPPKGGAPPSSNFQDDNLD